MYTADKRCCTVACTNVVYARGVCKACYDKLYYRVMRHSTSWEQLESEGRVRSMTNPPIPQHIEALECVEQFTVASKEHMDMLIEYATVYGAQIIRSDEDTLTVELVALPKELMRFWGYVDGLAHFVLESE